MYKAFLLFFLYLFPFGFLYVAISFFAAVVFGFSYKKSNLDKEYENITKRSDRELEILDSLKRFEHYKSDTLDDRLDIVSYKEILEFGEREAKINLIGLLSFTPNRDHVELIKYALNDNDETVKILASTAMQKMDDFFSIKIATISKQIELDGGGEGELYLELARANDDYLYSGLVPSESRCYYEEKMFDAYKKAYEIDSRKKEIFYAYLRALIRCERVEEADRLMSSLDTGSSSEDRALFWMAELAYLRGDFDEVALVLKKTKPILGGQDSGSMQQKRLYKSRAWWCDERM